MNISAALPPIAIVTTILVIFGYVAIIGGVVAFVGAFVRVLLFRKLPIRLTENRAEIKFLAGSFVSALLGCAWLFLAPAYGGTSCTFSTSSPVVVTTTRESKIGPNGETIEIISASSTMTALGSEGGNCKSDRKTFYEENGSRVIPLFTIPILFTLFPWIFYALRVRPIIEAFLAFLLGAQMAVGMSLYGAAFGPSGVIMLLAALSALRTERARSSAGSLE